MMENKQMAYVERGKPFDVSTCASGVRNSFGNRGVYIFYDYASAKPLYVGSAGADGIKGAHTRSLLHSGMIAMLHLPAILSLE
jgi:hypothetical protein